jgi:hypothetical protein
MTQSGWGGCADVLLQRVVPNKRGSAPASAVVFRREKCVVFPTRKGFSRQSATNSFCSPSGTLEVLPSGILEVATRWKCHILCHIHSARRSSTITAANREKGRALPTEGDACHATRQGVRSLPREPRLAARCLSVARRFAQRSRAARAHSLRDPGARARASVHGPRALRMVFCAVYTATGIGCNGF